MEKIDYDGEKFYFQKGTIYDASFVEIPKNLAVDILAYYFNQIDYHDYNEDALLTFINDLKTAELYADCLKIINFGLGKFSTSVNYHKVVFPIITSCYRSLKQPQEAINFWFKNKATYGYCISTPLLTSLAAAYCDIGNYDLAKKCADHAYAIQGGGKGYNTELSLVYRRIKNKT